MPELPTGTVTFLFTDIEGSTNLARSLGSRWPGVLDDHHELVRRAIRDHDGIPIRTEGDAFFAVFRSATDAIAACDAAQRSLAQHAWPSDGRIRVRMGLHTGEGRLSGGEYVGLDVHRAARIAAAGHGGQVLLSDATRTLVEHGLPEHVALRDLGRHRLKDFDEPQGIHQLLLDGLPSDFPAIRTLEVPTNLPARLSSFVGRGRQLGEVAKLLGEERLVTLTGPGGTGKTRLAIHVASEVLDRFADGVYFVELAPITDPELVPSAIASALRIGEEGPRPLVETLRHELRDRTALLVLDNFEQVLEAAALVATLLAAAQGLRCLVTSRGPLRIEGEWVFPVPPLELPHSAEATAPEDLTRYEAVALFLERAAAVDPQFTLDVENANAVAEICRRVDGLPLAIELAASRLRLLSPAAMLERLDHALPLLAGGSRDRPARQRTLRGAIAWSHDLLSPETAALFGRICVFAGGWTLQACDAVCNAQGDLDLDTMDGLEVLLDSGLIQRGLATDEEVRFDTLQTIREFGLERLDGSPDATTVRQRHARYFLERAQAAEMELRGPRFEPYLKELIAEHDNMRAALTWAIGSDEGDLALRLVSALWRFWYFHGDLSSGRRWAELALAVPSASARTDARARTLIAGGSLAYWQRDGRAALTAYEEALAIFRELGDPAGIAEGMFNLAFVVPMTGGALDPIGLFRASLATFEEVGDTRKVADTLFGLGLMSRLRGDLATARDSAEEALRLHQGLEDFFGIPGDKYVLGRVAAESGDLALARHYFMEVLDVVERLGERTGIALVTENMAHHANARGNTVRAMRLAGVTEAIKEAVGGEAPPELIHLPDPRDHARKRLSEQEIQAAWREGRAMTLEEAVAYTRADD